MACTGHTNSCPAHPNYKPAITPTVWTDSPVNTNTNIKAQHFNELRTAISNEITRRSTGPWSADPGAVVTQNLSYKPAQTTYRALRNGINQAKAWTYPSEVQDAALATAAAALITSTNTMRTKVNQYEAECACNCAYACTCVCNYCACDCDYCACNCNYCACDCDYACTCNCNYACTCNCNYCVCNCNYCVCNCNYCVCNCNYACVCNCAYSDRRLKKNIIYM